MLLLVRTWAAVNSPPSSVAATKKFCVLVLLLVASLSTAFSRLHFRMLTFCGLYFYDFIYAKLLEIKVLAADSRTCPMFTKDRRCINARSERTAQFSCRKLIIQQSFAVCKCFNSLLRLFMWPAH